VSPEWRQESFTILGHEFGLAWYRTDGHWYLAAKPAKKSVARVKLAIGASGKVANR